VELGRPRVALCLPSIEMRTNRRTPAAVLSVASLAALITAGCGGSSGTPASGNETPHPLEIAQVREVGVVGAPASVTARDVGATALLGTRLLWLFGDTLFRPRAVDGENLRTCTAATAEAARPLETSEATDANAAPFACMAFTPEEAAFNRTSGRADLRVALWPGSVVPTADGSGLVFYVKLTVNPGLLNYDVRGVGVARIAPGATTAARDPGLVFQSPEPTLANASVFAGTVYAYGLIPGGQNVAVAMAPLAQAGSHDAYRFWNGSAWVADARAAAPLFGGVSGALTVSYNAYLRRYLAVNSETLSGRVLMRVADHPEGPWGAPVLAFAGQAAAGTSSYAAREHAELAQDGGARVFVTYYRPAGGGFGDLRMMEVTFR